MVRNHLASSRSGYLRRHATDPVAWQPWGEEAQRLAIARDRPVFLSIGYVACHWCAAMQRESFSDPAIAALLNEHFVPVLVDRDERPDVDALYTSALLDIQGHAGWPATLFLLPDLRPFTGATYLPPAPRQDLPGLTEILTRVAELWRTSRGELDAAGQMLRKSWLAPIAGPNGEDPVSTLVAAHDADQGGFGDGAKFPHVTENELLLAAGAGGSEPARRVVRRNLDVMASSTLHDAIGGGFHRYCTDRAWSQPRFEKLLVDQAQLVRLYARASRVFAGLGRAGAHASRGDVAVVRDTVRYLWRDLAHPDGGFCSGESADDPRGEGQFYRWTASELRAVLADALLPYGIPTTGESALPTTTLSTPSWPVRELLDERRRARPRPARSDTRVVAWNGVTVAALAEAGRLLGFDDWVALAATTAERLLAERLDDGGVPRWVGERAPGFLDDHACLAEGLLALYQARPHEPRWLVAALELTRVAIARFRRSDGLFMDSDATDLPIRRPIVLDDDEPSGNARIAEVLRQLLAYGAPLPDGVLSALLSAAAPALAAMPAATSSLHAVASGDAATLVIAGSPNDPITVRMLRAWDQTWRPRSVVGFATGAAALQQFTALRGATDRPQAHLRRGNSTVSVDTPEALAELLG